MKKTVVALAVFVLLSGMCGCASSQSNASSGASSPEQPASVSSSSTAKSSAKTDYLSERGYVISLQGEFDAPYSVLANDEARSFVREETGKGTIDITESTEGCASGQKKVTATLQIVVDELVFDKDYPAGYFKLFFTASNVERDMDSPASRRDPNSLA